MSRAQRPVDLLGDLKELRERLDTWRRSPGRSHRVPEDFWRQALALCRVHSVSTVASRLGLSYTALKNRFHATLPREAPPFIELPNLFTAQEIIIEYQQAPGKMLRIHCRGPVPGGVLELVETFGRQRS